MIFFVSCQKSNEPLNKDKIYDVNITYIEDDNIVGFTPGDFLDIFDDDLSKLTYDILGYKIKYNLKNGVDVNKFYSDNRKVIIENSDIFKRDFIDIKNIDYNQLEKDILYSLSNETSANIKKLFGYEYGTPLKIIAENITPSYEQSILNIWNSPVKGRNELLDGKRLFEDITYNDSINHQFIALVDGSYLLIDDHETIYGECYLIKDGHIQLICHENETIRLDNLKL